MPFTWEIIKKNVKVHPPPELLGKFYNIYIIITSLKCIH